MKQTIMIVDSPNANGRIYPKEEIEKAIKVLQEPLLCTLGGNIDSSIDLSKVVGQITDVRFEGDKVVGTFRALKTHSATILEGMLSRMVEVSYSPVGFCNIGENGIISDYYLTSISIVLKGEGAWDNVEKI